MEARAALLAANELLRYRPVDDLYEEWLDRVAELIRAAGGSPAPSHSMPPLNQPRATGLMACVTPTMRLYLPRVEARLRGITA